MPLNYAPKLLMKLNHWFYGGNCCDFFPLIFPNVFFLLLFVQRHKNEFDTMVHDSIAY